MKKLVVLFFSIIPISLFASGFGFEIKNNSVFLGKQQNAFFPEAVNEIYASFFYGVNFEFQNQTLFLQPGIFITGGFDSALKTQPEIQYGQTGGFIAAKDRPQKTTVIRPFFKRLQYSLFTEYLFFSAGKDSFYFGEGFLANYFFIQAPSVKRNDSDLWHIKFDVPFQQWNFSFGTAVDTERLDRWTIPQWYTVWLKTEYSNQYIFAGLETDMLFKPELKSTAQKKSYSFKSAVEISSLLPYDFKLYMNAKLPVDIINKKITDWGILAGVSKNFLLNDFSFTSIAETSYSSAGIGYAFFQSFGLSNYSQITGGLMGNAELHGKKNNNLKFILEAVFFISKLNVKFSYMSNNVLNTKEKPAGIFTAGVIFNE
ncbi:hypothetical protein [Treponema pedis]|uniref:hypothetical protein n=1 Tax=Treponema pedis TaxID=409322 RepID=UPI0003F79B40|nr:hypothetical protein [Treponema pedis]